MRLEVQTGGVRSNSVTTERPGTAKYLLPIIYRITTVR